MKKAILYINQFLVRLVEKKKLVLNQRSTKVRLNQQCSLKKS